MNSGALERIVNAVLYEGYILHPYRASARKNQRDRFTFGRVYPENYRLARNGTEPCVTQTECLLNVAVEQEAENRIHFAVIVEDDPGKDLGWLRQPGHRFFYTADEIEPFTEEQLCAGF